MNGFIDITKCCSQNCQYRDKCYRVISDTDKFYQSWSDFETDCKNNNYRNYIPIYGDKNE